MDHDSFKSFKEKLDQQHDWPSLYTFKFIVPKGKEGEVKEIFPNNEATLKASKNGNYTSLTIQLLAPSSDVVIEKYVAAHEIEGIIAL
ncbi:MAG: DUF493 family protein [Bacteroidota bacterium]